MVLFKTWPLFQLFFKAIYAMKISFKIFQNEKKPFKAIKTRSSKSQKIDIFLKGLTHGFGPKMAIFPTFFLGNIGQENVFYVILERKIAFLDYECKFLGVIRILCNLRRRNSFNQGLFFWRETEISFITKIFIADGLRNHVTIITLREKSRYDLILKINETA